MSVFAQKRIDLSLNSAETNDLLVVGMTEKLKVNVSNLGNETFPACKLEVTLIDNSARNTNLYKQIVFSAPISALQMNQNRDLEFDMPIAKTIALKAYRLEVKVGTEASFGDLNQENNYIYSDVTLIDPIANLKKVQADYYMGGFAKPLLKDGKPCDCIEMTTEANNQKGQVYSFEKLDLTKDVILEFAYYFGTRDGNGADGQVFILHNDQRGTAAVGDFGEGMGYGFG
ncbi:MAG: hypothetical protein EAZ97_03435, partial [Bacteroidetes bacterium]